MSKHKYRLAHEYLISTIQLRTGDVETPVQKYDRLLLTRAQAWEKEKHDRRFLLGLKEIYHIFRIKPHLDWKDNPVLKRLFLRKSIIWRASKLMVYFSTLVILGLALNYYLLIKEADSTIELLKYKDKEQLTTMEGKLEELSSQPLFIKKRILSCLFSDTLGYYEDNIFPYISHSIINISPNQKERFLEYSLNNLSAKNAPNVTLFVFSTTPDSTFKKRYTIKLIELLQKADKSKDQINVINALKYFDKESRPAIPSLIELLNKTNNPDVQRNVASTLGYIGKDAQSAVTPLLELFNKTNDNYVQSSIIDALENIGKDVQSVVPPLLELLNNTNSLYIQSSIVYALGKIGNDAQSVVPSLLELLNKTNVPDVQRSIADALGKIGKDAQSVVPSLLELLNKTNVSDVQRSIADALGNIGNDAQSAVPSLLELFNKNNDTDVQKSIVIALGKIGNDAQSVVPSLLELLNKTNDPIVKNSIVDALGKFGKDPQSAVPSLLKLLNKTNNPIVQINIADALGKIGKDAQSAVPSLLKLLNKTNNPYVQRSIVDALGKIGKEAEPAVHSLLKLLNKTHDSEVQKRVADALGNIGKEGDTKIITALSEKYHETKDNTRKYAIVKVIIKIDPENREHYSKLLKEILPLPITGYKNKKEITQLVNNYANRNAKTASDSVKFNGNMWAMLEWWDKH